MVNIIPQDASSEEFFYVLKFIISKITKNTLLLLELRLIKLTLNTMVIFFCCIWELAHKLHHRIKTLYQEWIGLSLLLECSFHLNIQPLVETLQVHQ